MWKYLLDSNVHTTGTIKKIFQNIFFKVGHILWESNYLTLGATGNLGKKVKKDKWLVQLLHSH